MFSSRRITRWEGEPKGTHYGKSSVQEKTGRGKLVLVGTLTLDAQGNFGTRSSHDSGTTPTDSYSLGL